jgi:hypothetical protein
MSQQTINQGNPPIVWSTIDDAFQKINANFTELYLSIGGPGVDLSSIASDLVPDGNLTRDLGSISRRWRDLYLGGSSLYLGDALITADISGAVNLPLGSTVGGSLIKDPTNVSFGQISVAGQGDVLANSETGILNLAASGISITTVPSTDTITFTNTGVTTVTGSTGVSVSSATGPVIISNTGVTSALTGPGISVSAPNGAVTFTNTGVTSLTTDPGSGISLDAGTGTVNITNSAPNIIQPVHRFIAVSGQVTLDAIGPNSTLTLAGGTGIDVFTNSGTNTVTFALEDRLDIRGSVFADDSTLLVDAVNGLIPASVVQGTFVGNVTGSVTGNVLGDVTGNVVGDVKGSVFGDDSTKIVDAVENKVFAEFFGNIAGNVTGNVSGNLSGNANGNHIGTFTGNVFSNLIDSADSSEINIVPSVNCNSDLTVGGDILPNTDLGGNLGAPDKQWKSLYVSGSTIFLGGTPVSLEGGLLAVNGVPVSVASAEIAVLDEGSSLTSAISSINFVGAGVTATNVGPAVTVTISGGGGGGTVTWNDVTDKPTFATVATSGAYGDLSGTPTLAAVATSGDYLDLSNQPSIPSLGNITFVSTTIDSSDSSGIVFTPAVTFNSDITVENELIVNNGATVSGTLNVAALNVTGTITSQGSGTPELFSDNEILLTAGTRVEVSSSPLKMASFTSVERDGLSPINGDVIYNSTTNKFQGYAGGSWVDLH